MELNWNCDDFWLFVESHGMKFCVCKIATGFVDATSAIYPENHSVIPFNQVARFPASDPAWRILSVREPAGKTRPVGASM